MFAISPTSHISKSRLSRHGLGGARWRALIASAPDATIPLFDLLNDPGGDRRGECREFSKRYGGNIMERAEFERKLQAEGYTELFDRHMEAGETGPEHSHEFDALLLVLKGEMTITRNGKSETFRAGDLCSVLAGTQHAEQFGSGGAGVHYLAAWRYPASTKEA